MRQFSVNSILRKGLLVFALGLAACHGGFTTPSQGISTSTSQSLPSADSNPNPTPFPIASVTPTPTPVMGTPTPPPVTAGNGSIFYVATTGSDSAAGSLAAPWKTVQHALNSIQAGDTIQLRAGVYNESVNVSVSGSAAAGPVTLMSYPNESAVLDGTGLTPSTANQQGLINIVDQSYVTISGLEIRNYTTSNANAVPCGIWISGSGTSIQILNNQVHNITTTSEAKGNAFAIAVYGTEAPAALNLVTVSGNEVYDNRTGQSETVTFNGNVTNFTASLNVIHDNDNIGLDAIGFEGTSPNSAYDYARNGQFIQNTVYNISGITNPGEGDSYDADGIYVDGGSQILIEGNQVSGSDLGIEVASEHSGHVGSYITVRANLVYQNLSCGISIGGYDSKRGGTDHATIVNNTLYDNDTKQTGSGEFQVQYYATNNIFENNIIYAGTQNLFVNNYTNSEASPVSMDYNLYYSAASESAGSYLWNSKSVTGFAPFQTASGQEAHSQFANPLFVSTSTPNLQIQANSPASGAGNNLGATVEGTSDFAGTVWAAKINIGAY